MMLFKVSVIFCLCICEGHPSSRLSNHLLDTFKDICPYTDLCSSSAQVDLTATGYLPCCFPCHCDDLCWNFRDCCPDVQSTRRPGTYDIRCQSTESRRGKRKVPSPFKSTKQFMLLSECPDDYDGEEVKKCQGQFDTLPGFDDIVVVSDRRYQMRLFSNKHCAKCNGVTDLKRWSTNVGICDQNIEDLPDLTISALRHIVANNCTLTSTPPNGLDVNFLAPCRVEECTSETGDTAFSNACNQLDYLPMFRRRDVAVYKNVYCNMCSNDTAITTACAKLESKDRRRVVGKSLLSLIDMVTEVETVTAVKPSERLCAENEAFDDFFERCRRVRCPIAQGVFHGTCIYLGNFWHGVFIAVRFIFLPMSESIISIPSDVSLVSPLIEIHAYLAKHFNLEKCKAPLFTLSTFVYKHTGFLGYVSAILDLETGPECTSRDVIASLMSKAGQNFVQRVKFNFQSIAFRTTVDFHRPPVMSGNYLYNLIHDASVFKLVLNENTFVNVNKIPVPSVRIDLYQCPTYLLSMTEYNDVVQAVLSEKAPLINTSFLNATTELVQGFYPLSRYEIGICIDTYNRFTSSQSNGVSVSSGWFTYVSCLASAYFICII